MSTIYEAKQSISLSEQRRKDIIIVEDDESIGKVLMEIVKEETPYQSAHVTTGKQALFLAPQLSPRLLLLDYRLPDMTGLDVYQRLRAQQEQEPFATILMSAQLPARPFDIPGLIYMQKPFEIDLLLLTMKQLIESVSSPSS
jgi:DNA-binding response OmpR family regulator